MCHIMELHPFQFLVDRGDGGGEAHHGGRSQDGYQEEGLRLKGQDETPSTNQDQGAIRYLGSFS